MDSYSYLSSIIGTYGSHLERETLIIFCPGVGKKFHCHLTRRDLDWNVSVAYTCCTKILIYFCFVMFLPQLSSSCREILDAKWRIFVWMLWRTSLCWHPEHPGRQSKKDRMKDSNLWETQAGKSRQGLLVIALLSHCPAAIVIRRNEKPREWSTGFTVFFPFPHSLSFFFFSGTTPP